MIGVGKAQNRDNSGIRVRVSHVRVDVRESDGRCIKQGRDRVEGLTVELGSSLTARLVWSTEYDASTLYPAIYLIRAVGEVLFVSLPVLFYFDSTAPGSIL